MQTENKPLIVCDNLVKIYKVADLEVVALQGLDLIVNRGEMLGIVGTSGSGKSTLMNILGGLDRPSAGKVSVDGIDLLSLSDAALNQYQRSKVGFVWQQTSRNLIPYLTAIENIELPMSMAWVTNSRADPASVTWIVFQSETFRPLVMSFMARTTVSLARAIFSSFFALATR